MQQLQDLIVYQIHQLQNQERQPSTHGVHEPTGQSFDQQTQQQITVLQHTPTPHMHQPTLQPVVQPAPHQVPQQVVQHPQAPNPHPQAPNPQAPQQMVVPQNGQSYVVHQQQYIPQVPYGIQQAYPTAPQPCQVTSQSGPYQPMPLPVVWTPVYHPTSLPYGYQTFQTLHQPVATSCALSPCPDCGCSAPGPAPSCRPNAPPAGAPTNDVAQQEQVDIPSPAQNQSSQRVLFDSALTLAKSFLGKEGSSPVGSCAMSAQSSPSNSRKSSSPSGKPTTPSRRRGTFVLDYHQTTVLAFAYEIDDHMDQDVYNCEHLAHLLFVQPTVIRVSYAAYMTCFLYSHCKFT